METLDSVDPARIRALKERGERFWLDLAAPSDADLDAVAELVTIHPLALEDSREFGQRAKLDAYADSALLVVHGAEPREKGRPRIVEVHLHLSAEAVVTVSRHRLTALTDAHRDVGAAESTSIAGAVHAVLDALADSFLDALDGFDDAIDELQEVLANHATGEHRQRIFALRRQLTEMRQVVVPQRDLVASRELADAIPGPHPEGARDAFRDVHDHLDRAAGLIGAYREQIGGLLDLYLAEVSTHLNVVMKRLTVMATVFLPLTFLTGFFGMNFGWLVERLTSLWTFLAFGIGLLVVSTVAVLVYLRRTDPR